MRPLLLAVLAVLLVTGPARADVREPLPGCEGFEEELAQDPALHDCLRLD